MFAISPNYFSSENALKAPGDPSHWSKYTSGQGHEEICLGEGHSDKDWEQGDETEKHKFIWKKTLGVARSHCSKLSKL